MRKTLLMIAIAIALIMTSLTTVQAVTATAELKANSTFVKPGDTFTVTLSATCEDGINGIYGKEAYDGFGFSYDNAKLELVSREANGKLQDQNEDADADTIVLMGSSSSFTSGDVYTFTFKVKDNAIIGKTQISTTELVLDSFAATDSTVELGTKAATVEIVSDTTKTEQLTMDSSTTEQSAKDTGETKDSNKGSTTGTSTAGKSLDTTTTNTILPKAGIFAVKGVLLSVIVVLSIVMYKKYRKYDGIK